MLCRIADPLVLTSFSQITQISLSQFFLLSQAAFSIELICSLYENSVWNQSSLPSHNISSIAMPYIVNKCLFICILSLMLLSSMLLLCASVGSLSFRVLRLSPDATLVLLWFNRIVLASGTLVLCLFLVASHFVVVAAVGLQWLCFFRFVHAWFFPPIVLLAPCNSPFMTVHLVFVCVCVWAKCCTRRDDYHSG